VPFFNNERSSRYAVTVILLSHFTVNRKNRRHKVRCFFSPVHGREKDSNRAHWQQLFRGYPRFTSLLQPPPFRIIMQQIMFNQPERGSGIQHAFRTDCQVLKYVYNKGRHDDRGKHPTLDKPGTFAIRPAMATSNVGEYGAQPRRRGGHNAGWKAATGSAPRSTLEGTRRGKKRIF